MGHWQRSQQNSLNQCEDRGVPADSESESKDSDGSEAGIFAQHAHAEANVLEERFQRRQAATVADRFFGLVEAAKLNQSLAAGFFGRHTGAEIVINMKLQMGLEFGSEIAVSAVS